MFKPFSRRQSEAGKLATGNNIYLYNIERTVRSRIFYNLSDRLEQAGYAGLFDQILAEVAKRIYNQYGCIDIDPKLSTWRLMPAAMHFMSCNDDKAIDFLEFFLSASPGFQGDHCVEALNDIFRDEGIGYEFTPLVTRDAGPSTLFGSQGGGRRVEYDYPQAIKKSEEYGHQAIVRPCLDALAGPDYTTAHGEMLKAHEAYKHGDYPAAITSCGSAFESVLKTICDRKTVAYDSKDTCGPLVQKCQAGGLFPSFYTEIFKGAGTLRNQLSSAHGRGPNPTPSVTKEQADHMIQITSAHITFLVKTTA